MENQNQLQVQQTTRLWDRINLQTDSKLNLLKNEREISIAAQSGKEIQLLDEKELSIAATGLIFKIAVISGCQLPSSDKYINALEAEFINFLQSKYPDFTTEEVLTAFRMNANMELEEKVEKYGEIFSLDYVGKVLFFYKESRAKARGRIMQYLEQKEREEEQEKRVLELRTKANEQYQAYMTNVEKLDTANIYRQLFADGAFDGQIYQERFSEAIPIYYEENKDEPKLQDENSMAYYFTKSKIGTVAERLVVVDYFKALKKNKFESVYRVEQSGLCLNMGAFYYSKKKVESGEDLPF